MKKSKTTYSKGIEDFLNFLRDSENEYNYHHENVNKCDKEQQNILHEFEIPVPNYKQRGKLGTQLTKLRLERRDSKDTVELTKDIVSFYSENKPVIKKLERILGDIRKYENFMETRTYKQR